MSRVRSHINCAQILSCGFSSTNVTKFQCYKYSKEGVVRKISQVVTTFLKNSPDSHLILRLLLTKSVEDSKDNVGG